MKTSVVTSFKQRKKADLLILPFWEGKKGAESAFKIAQLSALAKLPIQAGDFKGKESEMLFQYPSRFPENRILLLGLGKQKSFSFETVRRSFSSALKAARRKKCKSINLLVPEKSEMEEECLACAMSEGLFLANYSFDLSKQKTTTDASEPLVENICFITSDKSSLKEIQKRAKITSAVNYARDLVNGNADDVTAQLLSQKAKELAKDFSSVKTRVLGLKELEKEKAGLILAVNRGAVTDPALILIEYRGDSHSKDLTALVGKGVTFDTGGLNLKPTGSIETMKDDMSGAAAVLGTIRAAASLGLKRNIIGVIPAVENAIGSRSYKPGDVYVSHSGKTVEISNTDAEGRLILADALSYLQKEYTPNRIIDLATLTGSIVVTLGEETTGLFSNNDELAKQLTQAGEKTYERVWRLPLYTEYKEALKSPIADLKNSGGRKAGAITAALFLQDFIKKDQPWAHLDIAGTAYLTETKKPYHPTSATGVGVRLLIQFLEDLGE